MQEKQLPIHQLSLLKWQGLAVAESPRTGDRAETEPRLKSWFHVHNSLYPVVLSLFILVGTVLSRDLECYAGGHNFSLTLRGKVKGQLIFSTLDCAKCLFLRSLHNIHMLKTNLEIDSESKML